MVEFYYNDFFTIFSVVYLMIQLLKFRVFKLYGVRRLTNNEFPNTVLVGQAHISANSRLTCRYRTDIKSC